MGLRGTCVIEGRGNNVAAQHHAGSTACGMIVHGLVPPAAEISDIHGRERPEPCRERFTCQGQPEGTGKHLGEQSHDRRPPGRSARARRNARQAAYTPSTTTMSMTPAFSRSFRAAAYSGEKAYARAASKLSNSITILRARPSPSATSTRPPRTSGAPPYFLIASPAFAAYSLHALALVTAARA